MAKVLSLCVALAFGCVGALAQSVSWPSSGTLIVGGSAPVSPPSVAVINGTAYMAFQGSNNGVYFAASGDGVNWPSTATRIFPSDTTSVAPDLCAFLGRIYLVMKAATTDELFVAWTADGFNWNAAHPQTFIPSDPQTPGSPSLVVFKGSLYLFFEGENNGLYVTKTSDGSSWSAATRIFTSDTTGAEPTVAVFQGNLYMVMKAQTTDEMFIAFTADGVNWNAAHPQTFVPSDPLSPTSSTLAISDCFLYLGWRGEDQGVYLSSSKDGTNWAAATRILPNDTTNGKLTLFQLKGNFILIWHSQTTNQLFLASASTSAY